MRLPWLFLTLTFAFAAIKTEFVRFDRHDYVPIITDVCKTHQISAVFFTHSGELREDLSVNKVLLHWTRALSQYGISTLNIHLWKLWRTSVYYNRIVRPLFIIVLTNEDTVKMFSLATKNMDVSFPTWLVIFVGGPTNYERDYCHDPPGNIFHVAFNTKMLVMCEGDRTLREWYALDKNVTKIVDFGVWKPNEGLVRFSNRSLFERRNNLEGVMLRALIVQGSSFANIQHGRLDGFFGKVLHELTSTMNFTFHVVKEVPNYGRWHPETDSWDGAMADLATGDIDIAVSDFSMTSARIPVVDFTMPLSISRDYLFIQELGSNGVQWLAYFWALSPGSWLSIVLIIALSPLLLTVFGARTRSHRLKTLMLDNYLHVWGIFCQQGLPEFPRGFSLRLAFVTLLLTALVVSDMYSAALISFLAIYIPSLPFASLEGFVKDGTYKLIMLRGSADYDIFANASDALGKKIMSLMKDEWLLPTSVEEGFLQTCSLTEKNAYFTAYEVWRAMRGKLTCKLAGINAERVDSLGMALLKGSPYTDIINYQIQKFINNGMLDRMKRVINEIPASADVTTKPIGLDSVAPILAILLGGFVLSTMVLTIEILYFASKRKLNSKLSVSKEINWRHLSNWQ